jgi:hypothetical protein
MAVAVVVLLYVTFIVVITWIDPIGPILPDD